MIKAILFDVDGVILDSFDSNLSFINIVLRKNGYRPLTAEEYKPLFFTPLRDVVTIATGLSDSSKIDKIIESYKDKSIRTKFPVLQKDSEKTIKLLAKKYPLGIVTGRINIYLFEPPMNKIKKFMKVAITYEDTERHKPDPEPLLLAAERLGINPKEIVYIGDAEIDKTAAKAAGMKFILFPKDCTFSELPDKIASFNKS